MHTTQTKRLHRTHRSRLLFPLLLACSSTLWLWGQTTYFSTKTGLIAGSPQPADQWDSLNASRWQVNPYNRRIIVAADKAGNYSLSLDAGTSFNAIDNPFGAAKDVRFHFDAADPNLLFAQSASAVSASQDQAAHWTALPLPDELPGPETGPLRFADLNTGRPRLFIARGTQIWEAPYDSPSPVWTASLTAESAITTLASNSEQSMLAAGAQQGSVYFRRSFDASGAWSNVMIRSGAVSAIAFDPLDDQRLAVGFSDAPANPAEAQVYVSYNAGLAFTPVAGLSGSVRQIMFVADNENRVRLYAVASHVFVTADFAAWYPEAGLDNQTVNQLQQVDSATGFGLIAESGRRMYRAALPGDCSSSVKPRPSEVSASGGIVILQEDANSSGCGALQSFSGYPLRVADIGSGSGVVVLAVDPNSGDDRNLYANLGHDRVVIHQRGSGMETSAQAASCQIMSVNPSHVGKGGGKVTITVRKTSACGFIAVGTPENWIETTLPVIAKNGTATVSVTVDSNPGTSRSGSVSFDGGTGKVAGAPVKITQDAGSTCNGATASITQTQFESAGGTATLTLKPSGVCPSLTAKSDPWITVHKTSTYQFSVKVAPNTLNCVLGGTIMVTDPTHPSPIELALVSISQAGVGGYPGGCSATGGGSSSSGSGSGGTVTICTGVKASLAPAAFLIGGGSATLTVTPQGTCAITITPSAAWITWKKTSTANQYSVSIASNSGNPARSGAIQLTAPNAPAVQIGLTQAGVTPPAKCTAISAALSQTSIPAAGGSTTLNVQSTGECSNLVVTSSVPWITVGSSATNAIPIQIAANTGSGSRSGTLTIAAGSVTASATLQQAPPNPPPCAYKVSPTSLGYPWSGGVFSVTVTANLLTCNWTTGPILSNFGSTTWVHLSRTQGTGSGTVQVSVDSDADSSIIVNNVQGREATVEVAGVQVSINQAALIPGGCSSLQMGIDRNSFGALGGQATLTLLAPNSCEWTLNSDAGWIQFPNGPSGIGNGKILLTILPNDQDVASRVAHITSLQSTPDEEGHTAEVTITEQGNE